MHLFGIVYASTLLATLAATVFLARSGWLAGRRSGSGAGVGLIAAAALEASLVFAEIIVRGVLRYVLRDTDLMPTVLDVYVPTAAALHAILVDDPERAEAHVRGVVVAREGEGVRGVEPAVVEVAALGGGTGDDHRAAPSGEGDLTRS